MHGDDVRYGWDLAGAQQRRNKRLHPRASSVSYLLPGRRVRLTRNHRTTPTLISRQSMSTPLAIPTSASAPSAPDLAYAQPFTKPLSTACSTCFAASASLPPPSGYRIPKRWNSAAKDGTRIPGSGCVGCSEMECCTDFRRRCAIPVRSRTWRGIRRKEGRMESPWSR